MVYVPKERFEPSWKLLNKVLVREWDEKKKKKKRDTKRYLEVLIP